LLTKELKFMLSRVNNCYNIYFYLFLDTYEYIYIYFLAILEYKIVAV